MSPFYIGAAHFVLLTRRLLTVRGHRLRLVERIARRLGFSRKRATNIARRVP